MTHPGGEQGFARRGRTILRSPLSTRHPETPRPNSMEPSIKSRGLSGPPPPDRPSNPSVSPKDLSSYRQDKGAGPAPVRSVSTPRDVKDLASRERVYRRKMRGGSECHLGRLADRLCAELARDAWQRLQLTGETAALSGRSTLQTAAAEEES